MPPLDGIPLAIEFAAGRVGTYGIRGIAELLDDRLTLLSQGRRNVPRHQYALRWELRSAISLARLWADQGRGAEALDLLTDVAQRFAEGSDTADLREATRLIRLFGIETLG